jgi:hypothetical protein
MAIQRMSAFAVPQIHRRQPTLAPGTSAEAPESTPIGTESPMFARLPC